MYIWIHVKYSSTSREKLFWYDKIIFQIMCVTVVQINRVLLPATLFSVSLCRFFSCLVSFFNTIFRFGLFLLHSYCWPCWSCTWINIYSKLIKSGVLFWKRDFKTSWSAYWPSLRPEKNHKLSRHVRPLKQLIFFQCYLTSWQTTHSTPQTVLINTQHPPVTHWRKLNLPFVRRRNHQNYYPKISTEFVPKNN